MENSSLDILQNILCIPRKKVLLVWNDVRVCKLWSWTIQSVFWLYVVCSFYHSPQLYNLLPLTCLNLRLCELLSAFGPLEWKCSRSLKKRSAWEIWKGFPLQWRWDSLQKLFNTEQVPRLWLPICLHGDLEILNVLIPTYTAKHCCTLSRGLHTMYISDLT